MTVETPEEIRNAIQELAPLVSMAEHIRTTLYPPKVVLVLPEGVLPGLIAFYGYDIERGGSCPMVGVVT